MALLLKASKVVPGNADEVIIESGQLIIGRLPSNHLVLPGSAVEPIHAMIELEDGEARLVDMASDDGVKLNGKTIEVVEKIKAGDLIQIGDVRIEVSEAEAETPVPKKSNGSESSSENKKGRSFRATQKAERFEEGNVKKRPRVNYGALFQPGKERPAGSTLEVVAFWDQSILDGSVFVSS